MIRYVVHPPALASALVAHLRAQGFEASHEGPRVWATFAAAADPTEERLVLGSAVSAWRGEHAGARVSLEGD